MNHNIKHTFKELPMKTKFAIIACTAFASFMLTNCSTTPISMAASNTPLQGVHVKDNLGKTTGDDSAVSVLGIFMIGHPDIDLAIKAALKDKKGDALINVRCYESYTYFLLFSISTVRVEGEAVQFAPAEETPAAKGKTR
jgi:hypothetical protein